jgi:ribulose-5-phosphate 4-epimerase/fuculose-1-phosphate aldolase
VRSAAQRELSWTQHEREFAALRNLSARVGSDPFLVQASNGNTSIKFNGTMWIKASGKLLAHARQDDLFVAVNLAAAEKCLRDDVAIPARDGGDAALQPSIETPMHAVLRHRIVIHVHSVDAIAWAIREDGPEALKSRLGLLRWQWVPYAASGNALAREVEKAVRRAPDTDVFVLGSHGLVICGDTCEDAEKLLSSVERRLLITPRKYPVPDIAALEKIAIFPRWQVPEDRSLHALATDPVCRKILKGGVLYPCQAMFLGETMPLMPAQSAAWLVDSKVADRWGGQRKNLPFIAVEGCGVLLNSRISAAERATLAALAEVLLRTEESAPLRYLSAAEVAEVIGAGAYGSAKAALPVVTSAAKVSATAGAVHSVAAKQLWSAQRMRNAAMHIPLWDEGRRILYIPNVCAAWLGSHAKRLRHRISATRFVSGS